MLKEDLDKLSQPYNNASAGASRDNFADAIGITLPNTRILLREVFSDLNTTTFGISWWNSYAALGTKRRIAISDHTYLCIRALEENLVEAKLHLMEAKGAWKARNDFVADAVAIGANGEPSVKVPPRNSALDDMHDQLDDIHVAGFLRAIGSTLDCLGATIAAVLAVPVGLLKSDLDKALKKLESLPSPTNEGQKIQVEFREFFKSLLTQVGPEGWLKWTLDFRNMYVHRGRRLHMSSLSPKAIQGKSGPLRDLKGKVILRTTTTKQLPQDPGLSEVEALLDSSRAPVLEEGEDSTLLGILESTVQLIDKTSAQLLQVWQMRRRSPALLEQPRAQWSEFPSGAVTTFKGYRPGSAPYSPTRLVTGLDMVKRMQAAALTNEDRKKWDQFD